MIVAVSGGERAPAGALAAAEAVGRELARRGCVLICGGRGGVMEAACRGARSEGGHTIGVLPGADRSEMNPFVEFAIVTAMGQARNVIIVRSADAVIAIDGSYGTLSEIGHALQLGKPVIGLDTWSFALGGEPDPAVLRASTPVEAVELALRAVAKGAAP
jgi:uncharacterized protein (TIGR00725 family)